MFPVWSDGLGNSQEPVCDQKTDNDRNVRTSFPYARSGQRGRILLALFAGNP